ncbi:phage holin family protein [Paenibacillus sp. QZ-Y1]|uniref:phage holin family protein n=1 Tax=Paenibacillus sp. QZ-Y1 TaxID=3414511 RepID=UPI003F7A86FC
MDNIHKFLLGLFVTTGTYMFGGWNDGLVLLAVLCMFDYLTGIAAAAYEGVKYPNDKTKGLNSNRGYWGIFKKFLMFMVVATLYRIDILLGLEGALSFMMGGLFFYIGNELISLTENLGRLDVAMPKQLRQAISALQVKSGNDEQKDEKEKDKKDDDK